MRGWAPAPPEIQVHECALLGYIYFSFQGLLRQSLLGERAVQWQHGPFSFRRAIWYLNRQNRAYRKRDCRFDQSLWNPADQNDPEYRKYATETQDGKWPLRSELRKNTSGRASAGDARNVTFLFHSSPKQKWSGAGSPVWHDDDPASASRHYRQASRAPTQFVFGVELLAWSVAQ